MMICPHCGMYMKPMGGTCEFCGKDIKKNRNKKRKDTRKGVGLKDWKIGEKWEE